MRMNGANSKHAKMLGNKRIIRQRVVNISTREETGDEADTTRW